MEQRIKLVRWRCCHVNIVRSEMLAQRNYNSTCLSLFYRMDSPTQKFKSVNVALLVCKDIRRYL